MQNGDKPAQTCSSLLIPARPPSAASRAAPAAAWMLAESELTRGPRAPRGASTDEPAQRREYGRRARSEITSSSASSTKFMTTDEPP